MWPANGVKTALRDTWTYDKRASRFAIQHLYRSFRISGMSFAEEEVEEGLYLTDPRTRWRSKLIPDSDYLVPVLRAYVSTGRQFTTDPYQ